MSQVWGKYTTFAIVVIVCVLFFYVKATKSDTNTWGRDTITIAVAEQPAFALVYIADSMGFFRSEGIDVNFQKFSLGRDALQSVLDAKADLATVYDVALLHKLFEGHNIKVVSTLHSSTTNHVITAFSKSGIKTAADLRHRKVGITKNTSTEYFLYAFLTEEGISMSDVRVVNLEPDLLVPSLRFGSIDAVVLFNPYIFNLEHSNDSDDLVKFYAKTYTEMSLLVGTTENIKTNSQKIVKVLRALYRAEEYVKKHKPEAMIIVDNWLSNYSLEGVQSTWDAFSMSLKLNNSMVFNIERESHFLYDTGVFTNDLPNLRSIFITDYLKQVKPEGVTLY